MTVPQMKKAAIKAEAARILADQGPLEAAHYLAQTLFLGRTAFNGTAFFGHLHRVTNGIDDPRLKPLGYLHDLVEDIKDDPEQGIEGWDHQDLADIGFDDFILGGVRALTRLEDEAYFDFIVRIGTTPEYIPVKSSDLTDNSNPLRLPGLPRPRDEERNRKYYLSFHYLSEVATGLTRPGTPFIRWMAMQPDTRQDLDLLKAESRHPDVLALEHVFVIGEVHMARLTPAFDNRAAAPAQTLPADPAPAFPKAAPGPGPR